MAHYSLGIDIGGTFTDIVVYDHDSGRQVNRKVLTTHDDPARAVAAGVDALLREGRFAPDEFGRVVHATTLFTNALIERKGAVTGLITTAGFADTLEIGRERKYELYDLAITKPEPLVPRNLRLEVPERTLADGSVRRRLDARALEATGAGPRQGRGHLHRRGVSPRLRQSARTRREAARLIAKRHRGVAVTTSHEVAPEIREFERASTAVANAYIKPLAHRYLELMARRVAELRHSRAAPADALERRPHPRGRGPARAGADARVRPGRGRHRRRLLRPRPTAAARRVLAFDMGGTTAKLSWSTAASRSTAYSFEAARQRRFIEGSGLPIRISTIELIEIGAGGGSIADVDEIGLLKVGPRSAGSHPGPAVVRAGRHRAHA